MWPSIGLVNSDVQSADPLSGDWLAPGPEPPSAVRPGLLSAADRARRTGDPAAGSLPDHRFAAGLKPHPLFDPQLVSQPASRRGRGGAEPLSHFVVVGWKEGRSGRLVRHRPLCGAARPWPRATDSPLIDYLEGGAWQIGEAQPGFPNAAYLAATPSLVAEGVTPLEHWASLGKRASARPLARATASRWSRNRPARSERGSGPSDAVRRPAGGPEPPRPAGREWQRGRFPRSGRAERCAPTLAMNPLQDRGFVRQDVGAPGGVQIAAGPLRRVHYHHRPAQQVLCSSEAISIAAPARSRSHAAE